MKQIILLLALVFTLASCNNNKHDKADDSKEHKAQPPKKSVAQIKTELKDGGYEIFDYVDPKTQDTVIMQQYFIAFLKSGPNRDQSEEEANKLQEAHLAHLGKMYELGYADISGPFGDDGDIRGITIYNVPNLQMADSLANVDPAVKAGRLVIEVHPWWAAKGFPLR
ncbi:MAG: YciI family protein [Bacteroidota bacterium]